MNIKDFMIKSLTDLLEEGESLSCPFYGVLNQGNSQFFGYFGLSETHLLIALVSGMGNQITYTTRVPLDIKSVKTKQTAIFRQYVIDISFNEGAPCRITASPKVLAIGSQKENLLNFIDILDSKSSKNLWVDLKESNGEKIRRQYFNSFIYTILFFIPMIFIIMLVISLTENSLNVTEVIKSIPIVITAVVALLSPFVILSLLNRFFFGKIVSVICDKGLLLENDMIPWEDIEKVTFKPNSLLLGRRTQNIKYTYATVDIKSSETKKYSIDIMHFPRYGLKKIKKQHPEIKIEWGKKEVTKIIVVILTMLVLSAVIPFIK